MLSPGPQEYCLASLDMWLFPGALRTRGAGLRDERVPREEKMDRQPCR